MPLSSYKNNIMPYQRRGKCVYNKETGAKKGCSDSIDGAKAYMKALYSNEIREYLLNEEHETELSDKEQELVDYYFRKTVEKNHGNLVKNYKQDADRVAYGAAVNKVKDDQERA
jgi:hypothetical protein